MLSGFCVLVSQQRLFLDRDFVPASQETAVPLLVCQRDDPDTPDYLRVDRPG